MRRIFEMIVVELRQSIVAIVVAGIISTATILWGVVRNYVVIEVPVGAVIAFDLADGCPKDGKWTPFDAANGRAIVGAGNTAGDIGEDNQPIVEHRYHDRKGQESTRLTEHNLPPFKVPLFFKVDQDEGDKPAGMVRNITADSSGSNHSIDLKAGGTAEPFSREMPNLALYYCKKTT